MGSCSSEEIPDIGDLARYRASGGGRWAGEVRPRTWPLAADEVAVRGRHAARAGLDQLAVRADAQRAARLAPFEARSPENLVQALGPRGALDAHRAGHHPGPHVRRDPAPAR